MENIKKVNINGKNHEFCEYMFGVLAMDHNNPLCCVSEANNSFSIDYWKGCPYQCAYCHVQGIYEDLDESYHMHKHPIPRSKFTIEQIIDALVKHPYFKKDISIISIGTSSTEPFGENKVIESTMQIMEYFVTLGLKNPFWIVTKAGIPDNIIDRLKRIIDHGNKIMISICWANNPKIIEPVQNNRFKNIKLLKNLDLTVSWYMRPLVSEWSANPESLEKMIQYVSEYYYDDVDMIVPGGLRWTEGIEYGLKDVRNLEMPKLIKEYNKKTLSEDIENVIVSLCKKYLPNKPVYFNSSCAISHMLERNNIAALNLLNSQICNKSICLNKCKKKCGKKIFNKDELLFIEKYLKDSGIEIKIKKIDGLIDTIPSINSFSYTESQEIKKVIAYAINKMGVFNES